MEEDDETMADYNIQVKDMFGISSIISSNANTNAVIIINTIIINTKIIDTIIKDTIIIDTATPTSIVINTITALWSR